MATATEYIRVEARIEGMVQGVGFRYWAAVQARSLELCGSAENLPDGSVEVVVCGKSDSVDRMLLLCHTGPAYARVGRVTVISRSQVGACPEAFRILR